MSALWAPITGWREDRAAPAEPRSRLQAVAPPAARLARFPPARHRGDGGGALTHR